MRWKAPNFELRKGEHVAIMGDNGAGKSTFVRQITARRAAHQRQDLVRRQGSEFCRPDRGAHGGHRDRVPEPGAGRRPRRAVEPVPRPRKGAVQSRPVLDPRPQIHAQGDRGGADPHGGEDPQPVQHHPPHVGRPAPVRGDRQDRDLRLQADHHGRADGGARRAGDGAGRKHHPHAEGQWRAADPDQPQHAPGVRPCATASSSSGAAASSPICARKTPTATTSSPTSPAPRPGRRNSRPKPGAEAVHRLPGDLLDQKSSAP